MAGDAVDFPTSGPNQWQQFYGAAQAMTSFGIWPPCKEPAVMSGYGHLHLDWRVQYGTTGTFRWSAGHCPNGW